jgi:hypothetical protein
MFGFELLLSWLMLGGALGAAAIWVIVLRRRIDIFSLVMAIAWAGLPWLLAWGVGGEAMIQAQLFLAFEAEWGYRVVPFAAIVIDGVLAAVVLVQILRAVFLRAARAANAAAIEPPR